MGNAASSRPTLYAAAGWMTIVMTMIVLSAGCSSKSSDPELLELQQRADMLEQRKTRVEDLYAIKRLQRAYGYYLDQAQWDEMADLFADDGSIEIGLDGVYQGKARVREYLRALGQGRDGLAPGQVNIHMQLMPVVTLTGDGKTAYGTWRDIIAAGEVGKRAVWGEGPYENEYVKENGVWKLKRLRWFQTLAVPYEGGWVKHDDMNGARYVTSLQPDAPPTEDYQPWPSTFVPPFHFRPDAGGSSPPTFGPPIEPQPAATEVDPKALAQRAAQIAQGAQRLQDQYQIENLQRIYGYYLDKGMWQKVADLFTDDGVVDIAGRGQFVGKASVLRYFEAIGEPGVAEGRLFDNMQLQPIVHVAPDGQSAKGRWRLFAQLAQHTQFHEWGFGVYENEYVKDNGVWKISKLNFYPTLFSPFEAGWGKQTLPYSRFEPQLAPDRPSTQVAAETGTGFVAPFHYPHPVTGGPLYPTASTSPTTADDAQAIRALLDAAERDLSVVENVAQIENLQTIYGYYLATLEWDALADLFDEDGTIEIALRGVYVGKAAVRRNLNLYGQQGLDHGNLHNHMQFQPVIHIAEDGQSAKLRSRALSMMGVAGKHGTWMGGIYENEFIKVNGTWKFKKDQVMNNYFAPYDIGWKELPLRPAPGITESNPPDRPPSFHFDLYPKNFLPPYHYPHPVTGE